jgi:nucleotide-binding universal stress UspA family protein
MRRDMDLDSPLILAATDFSLPARNVVQTAGELARKLAKKVLLVHALDLPHDSTLIGKTVKKLVDLAAETRRGEEALRNEAKVAKIEDVLQGVEVLTEDPGVAIPALARERNGSLLVIGTSSKEGLKHFFLGSVAEKILRHSTIPVLVVPMPRKG